MDGTSVNIAGVWKRWKAMDRLTDHLKHPFFTFNSCQLCGFTSDDICEFYMWQECDEQDQPEPYNVLVVCRQDACQAIVDRHPRAYRLVPWGQGKPGHLMLLCGPCAWRDGARCTHPDLKANGGEGLQLYKSGALPKVTVCYHDDTREDGGLRCDPDGFPNPFSKCDGFREKVKC